MPWTLIGTLVATLLPKLIGHQETAAPGRGEGETKKSKVKEIVLTTVEAVEGVSGLDVFNDPEVAKLYDQLNDATVAFQNAVARKKAEQQPNVAQTR